MISRIARRRLLSAASRRVGGGRSTESAGWNARAVQKRWMTPAPKPGDGPMMSRRADRELPDVGQVSQGWRRTMPIFLAVVAANRLLGDEIYFKHQIPWISGEMNQVKGRIDISFSVRGSKAAGVMRFASFRPSNKALFETTTWSLTMEDGTVVDLLDGNDPFKGLLGDDEDDVVLVDDVSTKGFRQQGAFNR
ncbi:hypothetical protein TrVFT333_009742 [Trichoderma virens FT-333]|nr:hypothetical protein TrVFT333_009742 [Trichoderma virens FT-333]